MIEDDCLVYRFADRIMLVVNAGNREKDWGVLRAALDTSAPRFGMLETVREYNAAVRTKAFLISLVVFPVLIGGSVGLQLLLKDKVDTAEKRFAVIDRTPGEKLVEKLAVALKQEVAND